MVHSSKSQGYKASEPIQTSTKAELSRLHPSKIYVLGGTDIPDSTLTALSKLASKPEVKRIGGSDRYQTALKIAAEALALKANSNQLYIATGANFPDALTASAFAASQKVPILLNGNAEQTKKLEPDVASYVKNHKPETVYLFGGEAALHKNLEAELLSLGAGKVVRLGGGDRDETAKTAITSLIVNYRLTPRLFAIASNSNYPDALVGGASVGIRGGILLPTSTNSLSAVAENSLKTYAPGKPSVEVFGGTAAVSNKVVSRVLDLLGIA
jgi:putative cell wall-binding protein